MVHKNVYLLRVEIKRSAIIFYYVAIKKAIQQSRMALNKDVTNFYLSIEPNTRSMNFFKASF